MKSLMMKDEHRALLRSSGIVIARISLGALFFLSGVQILQSGMAGINGLAGAITSVGLPAAGTLALAVVAIKILGGGALMLGYRTGLAAASLLLFTALATFFFHTGSADVMIFGVDVGLFKNLGIMGGLLYAMAYGPGDGWRLKI
jgi:putative oxidoreductase